MSDPITIGVAVITSLVGAYKAYTEYKAAVVKAQAEQKTAPAKDAEATKGEQVAQVIETGIQQYGDEDERTDLANFAHNPDRYREGLARVLSDVAVREPTFAQQLQTLAQQANIQSGGVQQANIQSGGVQGSVNVSGEGKIYGTAVGTNTGTVTGTYNIGDDKDGKK